MAKPSDYIGANVALTDTFSSWVELTNEITYDLATVIVTVGPVLQPNTTNGAWTTGNAHIDGRFSANVAIATDYLRGGSVELPSTLLITTNTVFQSNGNEGTANSVIVSNNTVSQLSGNVYITTAGLSANADATRGIAYADQNSSREFIVDFGTFTHTQGLMTVSGNTIFDMASVGDNSGRIDMDVQDLDVTANSYFFAQNLTANNRMVEIGNDGTDYMNVNSESFFHANVTVGDDGTDYLLVNSNTYFTSNVQIGDSATADFLRVNSNTFINNYMTIGSDGTDIVNVNSVAYFNSNTTVGDTSADNLYVIAQSEFGANVTVNTSVGLFKSDAANNYFSANVNVGSAGTDYLKVDALAQFNSNVVIGDTTSDILTLNARVATDIDPNANGTISLGSTGLRYAEIWVDDAFITNNVEAGLFSSTSGKFYSKSGTENLGDVDLIFGVANNTSTFDIFGANTTAVYDLGQDVTLGTVDNPWKEIYIDGIDVSTVDGDTLFTDEAQYITSANVVLTAPRVDFPNPDTIVRIAGQLIVENDSFAGFNSIAANNIVVYETSELRKSVYLGNTDSNDPDYTATMTVEFGANTSTTGNIIPSANNTDDLGSSTKYYSTVYANNIVSPDFNLDSLNDVVGSSTTGQLLKADGDGTYSFTTLTLNYLEGVNAASPTTGSFLTANSTGGFEFTTPTYQLDDLTDINVTSSSGQVLKSDGDGTYSFETMTLGYLNDVDVTGTNGQFLTKTAAGFELTSSTLALLADVETTGQANASILYYNADNDDYRFSTLAGLYSDVALDDVTDVDATSTAGQVLTANSTGGFEFTTLNLTTTLEALTDVDINSPQSNQVLKYDGTKWVNGVDDNFIGATVSIDTVPPTSPTNGDLWYDDEDGLLSVYYEDGTSSQWVTIGGGGAISQAVANVQVGSVDDLTDGVTYNSGVSIGIGSNALANDDGTTNYNTAFGFDALRQVTSGNQNVGIGANAGENLVTGFNNIVIGYNASASSSSAQNEITLGDTNINSFRVPGLSIEAQGNYFTAGGVTMDTGFVTATGFDGDLEGNVTGDVTGNLTGNVTGNVTGNLTGDVTGDLTGDVTGNLTGGVTGTVSDLSNHSTSNVTFNAVTTTQQINTANVVATNSVSAANVVSSGGVIGSEFISGSQANPAFFANSSVVEITNLGAVGSNTVISVSDDVSVSGNVSATSIISSNIYANVVAETVNNIGTGNSITVTSGGYVISTPSASITYSFDSTGLLSGRTYSFVLRTTPSAAITITWPANVLWSGGVVPDVPASGETDTYIFVTTDQGATWYGYQSGDAFA